MVVTGIYRGADSVLIGTYEYDAWGNIKSVKEASSGIDTDNILIKNPFRYRSYMYDNETGFYYLKARLYDSTVKRFISADTIIMNVGERAIGYNLYQYAYNNPVNYSDSTGHMPELSQGDQAIINGILMTLVTFAFLYVTGGTGLMFIGGATAEMSLETMVGWSLISGMYGAGATNMINSTGEILSTGKEKDSKSSSTNVDKSFEHMIGENGTQTTSKTTWKKGKKEKRKKGKN